MYLLVFKEELAADNHTTCGSIANLHQIDTGVGHSNGLFVVGVAALGNQTANHVEDTDGLLLGTADDDVVVRAVDSDIVTVHIDDAFNLFEVGIDSGFGGAYHIGDGLSVGIFYAFTFPVEEAEASVGNGVEDDGVTDEAFVVAGLNLVDEHGASIGVASSSKTA